ncbi:dihydrofolate reductase [Wenzhouxiangella sp. EGI_FJ10305]|uniref:dihydrofolate reductase n=1 Tax=Wenzhouxiangella sp. EGI_FJ10305 TaxID=3243768 RepID=UPI0035D9FCC8
MIAAMARNRVIGDEGDMPWHLPADLKHFKAVTMGCPIVMGRRTFESIGRPLPGRANIVISRSRPDVPQGIVLAGSLEEALKLADSERVMVIGGGQIYREALPRADRLELTLIDAVVTGDTVFPEWPTAEWRLSAMQSRPADDNNPYNLVFATFERVATRE